MKICWGLIICFLRGNFAQYNQTKLGFIGVLRQIPSESVGAIHESPASKLGFIGEFGKR